MGKQRSKAPLNEKKAAASFTRSDMVHGRTWCTHALTCKEPRLCKDDWMTVQECTYTCTYMDVHSSSRSSRSSRRYVPRVSPNDLFAFRPAGQNGDHHAAALPFASSLSPPTPPPGGSKFLAAAFLHSPFSPFEKHLTSYNLINSRILPPT